MAHTPSKQSKGPSWLKELIELPKGEAQPLAWSFLCFFSILCGYFLLRPIRDEMAIQVGPEHIPDLFVYTFLVVLTTVPLFGWITKRLSRRIFMPLVFGFFISNLLVFYAIVDTPFADVIRIERVFFVWISVFNMFIVALFWSFMNDLFNKEQARRLFGYIAAGGSAGAIVGPFITASLIQDLGLKELLLVAAGLLSMALVSILRLFRWARQHDNKAIAINSPTPIGGSIFEGLTLLRTQPYILGIGALTFLGTLAGTALYMYQAKVIGELLSDSAQRTQLLSYMDMSINTLTLIFQAGVARLAISRLGVGKVLLFMPVLSLIGFTALLIAPSAYLLIGLQVLRRATGFGLNGPARETLYSVVDPQAKYKAKNFIDVSVVRGSDVLASSSVRSIASSFASFAPIAIICMGICSCWIVISHWLGRRYKTLYDAPGTAAIGGSKNAETDTV
ncbi:MAG: MFS transporter [Pseudomonadota bacterium]